MKRILMGLLLFLSIGISAQTIQTRDKISEPPASQVPVAQDVWIVASGKTSFRVITANDSIAHRFVRKFEGNGMTKSTYIQRKDRNGYYWERSFYFKNDCWNMVTLFINNKFR